ncbi:MAG: diguanylate cyclase [Gallionellaceae bacterium]|nr:diguanylate cyclase [Gallionellaceae bacterium]
MMTDNNRKASILIVDDNAAKRLALTSVLEQPGQDVVAVESGRDALRLLLQHNYAVILLDVQMPEMNGFETAALIRSRKQSETTPIIFVTAYTRAESDMLQGYSLGAVDFIFTPIIPEVLRAKVAVFVDLHRQTESLKDLQQHLETLVEQRTEALTAEVAERNRAEAKVTRLNRLYAVLSGINTASIRIRDRQQLFVETCNIAVQHGQFRMAWIGWPDAAGTCLIPVAKAGFEAGYLDQLRLPLKEAAEDNSSRLFVRVLRDKMPAVCNDINTNPQMASWREEALQRDYRSAAVFPLMVGDQARGVLALYAQEVGFFDTEEMKLLTELAADVSFALEYNEKGERLNYLAYYDALTGLANRVLFQDRLNQALTYAQRLGSRLAVLYVDLDYFKNVNDSLGHNAGDQLLKQAGARLAACVRDCDTMARLSGDEFAAILVNVISEDAVALMAHKIIRRMAAPFMIDNHELSITSSIGIAFTPRDGESSEALLKSADTALYHAKYLGRNNIQLCTAEMTDKANLRLKRENKLRRALKLGQFELHYQPKIEVQNGRISGLEALIRWNDPENGLVLPVNFIPILEETGMIFEVGRWAMQQALADCRLWHKEGLQPPLIAVNVSATQLQHKDFVEMVERELNCAENSCTLEFEITESMVMQDVEASIAKLQAIREMGGGSGSG